VLLLDTSGVIAALDADQRHHDRAATALRETAGPYVLSPFVLAELDYLLATKVGTQASLDLLDDIAQGAYELAPFGGDDVARARAVIDYGDQDIGLADASIVVLAERHATREILTLDERHFRVLRGPGGIAFRLLPADDPE
jgi:uncharacterized protein